MEEREIKEEDVNYFKITDYDREDPIDKLFIQQELLYQKHKLICSRLEKAPEDTNLMRSLEIEKKKIEKDAKENADKILKIHEEQEAVRKYKLEELEKEKLPPNQKFVTKRKS